MQYYQSLRLLLSTWSDKEDKMKPGQVIEGYERGVHWKVDGRSKINSHVILSVKSAKGSETYEQPIHKPIFGYDAFDMQDGEAILDSMIERYATEEFDI